ncbi:putative ATP-dependent endonuclease of the OLD family [Gracilibacillus ureilyticus]|uniref:Putative ATP-dependent endonuclease of the OLD family n=2 Tax=Gracilibacillus ureilyticus TaxID=531814 RepID=A0A1H9T709_9BACI|nr:putative ATP-dependent endonuclease of the OLD family [Gracilibacillus ureilyticus]
MEAEIYEDINKQMKIKKIVQAGPESLESGMEDTVRHLLSVTYLKPLRDAAAELRPGKRSRIAQVVKNLSDFADDSPEQKQIIDSFAHAFDELKTVLSDPVLKKIGETVDHFFEDNNRKEPEIRSKEMSFVEILRKLELNLGEVGTGLGSSNLLFMAVELLLLSEAEVGPKIALIEEVEAHIHPQAQLRIIKHFEKDSIDTGIQYIFTSHSPVLASSISLESIIFVYNKQAYPMRKGYTKLDEADYEFLERFLDATKANMFFAQGVIFVEGDAENILLPAISEVIGRPLHRYGVSIINVGNLAFKRYTSIFLRYDESKLLNFPVSIITDLDLKPIDYYDEPCYIMINEKLNREIANLYGCEGINRELEKIYVTTKDMFSKSRTLYGSKIKESLSLDEQSKKFKEIHTQIAEILQMTEPQFEEFKEKNEYEINERYFNNIEKTKVFISRPWTLEHSIALSSLGEDFENILLESHYTQEVNRDTKKKEWERFSKPNQRATAVYRFLLEKEVSKAVVAQKFAKFMLDNKSHLKEVLLSDEFLKHLVDAIYHVTGGEDGAI